MQAASLHAQDSPSPPARSESASLDKWNSSLLLLHISQILPSLATIPLWFSERGICHVKQVWHRKKRSQHKNHVQWNSRVAHREGHVTEKLTHDRDGTRASEAHPKFIVVDEGRGKEYARNPNKLHKVEDNEEVKNQ